MDCPLFAPLLKSRKGMRILYIDSNYSGGRNYTDLTTDEIHSSGYGAYLCTIRFLERSGYTVFPKFELNQHSLSELGDFARRRNPIHAIITHLPYISPSAAEVQRSDNKPFAIYEPSLALLEDAKQKFGIPIIVYTGAIQSLFSSFMERDINEVIPKTSDWQNDAERLKEALDLHLSDGFIRVTYRPWPPASDTPLLSSLKDTC
jgi:hypothetical protein